MLLAFIFAMRDFSSSTSVTDMLKFIHGAIKQKGSAENYFETFLLLRPQDRGKIQGHVSRPQGFNFSAVCSHHDGCAERGGARMEDLCCKEVWRNYSLA